MLRSSRPLKPFWLKGKEEGAAEEEEEERLVQVACIERWHASPGRWILSGAAFKQRYTGDAALRFVRLVWGQVATREETDPARLSVANEMAESLTAQGEFSEAARVHREAPGV